ncbi:hypothetical protein Dcar01_03414 [Deinococcus carri]|uniref:PatA-like N-terminal domain-containing protein n=1 Tax=Deinococcus carri TaxID=1211323 RepID=A0ABP9WF00_9DEIO
MTLPLSSPASTTDLTAFDPAELLHLLAERGRTGVFRVAQPAGEVQVWLEGGRVRHLRAGSLRGPEVLAHLLREPVGRFHFEEGFTHPAPDLDAHLDELLLEALDTLPEAEPRFGGPARIASPERVARLGWTERQRELLRQIEAGRPLAELARQPGARPLLAKLTRLRLVVPRSLRVARLTVGVTHERAAGGAVSVDALILARWQNDLARLPGEVRVRNTAGRVVTLPVQGREGIGPRLLLTPELLLRVGLRGGESVQVRPV